jgi:hypothetical protein
MPIQLATLQLATLQLATLQLVTFQLATLTTRHSWHLATRTTRHSDNSPLWQLATWQLATMTTRHPDNSPPLQLVTMASMPGSVSLFWLFFTSMFALHTAPRIFHYNILQIFGSDQWDLVSHNLFVIFFIRLYRCLLQMNYISCPKFCVVVFVD